MDASCPSPETLSAYQDGALDAPFREALERHGALCPSCRETLVLAGVLRKRPVSRPVEEGVLRHLVAAERVASVRRWRVAAAVLLIAAGAGWLALRGSQAQPASSDRSVPASPTLEAGFPSGRLGSTASPKGYWARGAEVLLGAGALAEGEGRRLKPLAGTLWVEASGGEPVLLSLPGASLMVARGAVSVTVEAPAAAAWDWLLSPASAAGPGRGALRVWVLEGQAEVTWEGRRLTLAAGAGLLGSGEAWSQVAASGREIEALLAARAEAAAALPGRELAAPGFRLSEAQPRLRAEGSASAPYRWVTVLRDRSAATEIRLTLPVDGTWCEWTVGLAGAPPLPREVLEVAWDGERLVGRVNGRARFAVARGHFPRDLLPSGSRAWEISVWGGSAMVARSVLQEGGGRR